MPKVRIHCFTISADGYGAGPNQDLENPVGVGGHRMHEWAFATSSWRRMHGQEGGATGIDDDYVSRADRNIGAWVIGRNMFGPVRGPWPDECWKGWWGENPPYHTPVFVLTHHARNPIEMAGGTTFHFVTDGIRSALRRAAEAAQGRDVRIGGGVATVQSCLRAGLVDEMHLAVVPVLLGSGENLFQGIDLLQLGYRCTHYRPTPRAAHIMIAKAVP
jgi:dihydrofolate reductase